MTIRRIIAFALFFAALPLAAQEVDDKPPLAPKKPPALPEKYRLDPSQAMFRAIEDENPLRSEKENPDEYRAWTEVVSFAKKFPVAELEGIADRFLTSEDLIQDSRRAFFLKPIRFEGLVKSAVREDATKALQQFDHKDTYFIRVIPTGEPFNHQILYAFSDLPPGIDSVEKLKDRWVSFAGYSFKLMTEPPEGNVQGIPHKDWPRFPVIVGQSVTVLPNGPQAEADSIKSIPNKELRIFQLIRDAAPIAGADNWAENAAWNRVCLYARNFSEEELEKNALRGPTFNDLFLEGRDHYKLDLIHFEGRLIRLKKDKSPRLLEAAGFEYYYVGWLVPNNQPSGQHHPICIILTELPEGLEPAVSMNRQVTFAGYFFKLMHYESGERDPKTDRFVMKGAPLLIGRSVTLVPEQPYNGGTWGDFFVPAILIGFGGILGTAGVLSWYFRRGDNKVKEVIAQKQTNPFGN